MDEEFSWTKNIEEFCGRRISKNFCNVSVGFLCNYKKDLFSGHFAYKLEIEEIYTEQIFFLLFHRF